MVATETVDIPARREFLIKGKLNEKVPLTLGTVGLARETNGLQNVLDGGTLVIILSRIVFSNFQM